MAKRSENELPCRQRTGDRRGLEADAPNRCLQIQPVLLDWLPDVQLTNVIVGSATVDLNFWREDEQTHWKVIHQVGELDVSEIDRIK